MSVAGLRVCQQRKGSGTSMLWRFSTVVCTGTCTGTSFFTAISFTHCTSTPPKRVSSAPHHVIPVITWYGSPKQRCLRGRNVPRARQGRESRRRGVGDSGADLHDLGHLHGHVLHQLHWHLWKILTSPSNIPPMRFKISKTRHASSLQSARTHFIAEPSSFSSSLYHLYPSTAKRKRTKKKKGGGKSPRTKSPQDSVRSVGVQATCLVTSTIFSISFVM